MLNKDIPNLYHFNMLQPPETFKTELVVRHHCWPACVDITVAEIVAPSRFWSIDNSHFKFSVTIVSYESYQRAYIHVFHATVIKQNVPEKSVGRQPFGSFVGGWVRLFTMITRILMKGGPLIFTGFENLTFFTICVYSWKRLWLVPILSYWQKLTERTWLLTDSLQFDPSVFVMCPYQWHVCIRTNTYKPDKWHCPLCSQHVDHLTVIKVNVPVV